MENASNYNFRLLLFSTAGCCCSRQHAIATSVQSK